MRGGRASKTVCSKAEPGNEITLSRIAIATVLRGRHKGRQSLQDSGFPRRAEEREKYERKLAELSGEPEAGPHDFKKTIEARLMKTHTLGWLSLLIAICLAVSSSSASDWPLGRFDPAGSAATQEDMSGDLQLLWEKTFPETEFDTGPVVVAGIIYIADADGTVRAIKLADGETLWSKSFEDVFLMTSPSYRDGMLYIGDVDGKLRALDATQGDLKWTFDTEMEIDAGPNFFEKNLLLTSHDGTLYSIDGQSGALVWKYTTEAPIQCGATLAGNTTFLGGCDEFLHMVNVADGKKIGEPLPLYAPTGSTPSVSNGIVYIPTSAGEILAYRPGESEPVWRFSDTKLAEEFKKSSVAIGGGLVIAASQNKRVFALDALTGEVKWVEVLRKRSDASPIIAGNNVFVAAADGRIIRFDLQTGKQTWMMEVKPSIRASPAVADGKLIVATDRGTVFCFGIKP